MAQQANVVICGAGIAGISVAYQLAVCQGVDGVLLVDERAPLSLTSDKSSEAYRNWWPGPDDAMIRLMNRSIDLLEDLARETDNRILLNRRGYLYATADPARAAAMREAGEQASALGAGDLRIHESAGSDYRPSPAESFAGQPDGADLLLDPELIQQHFPYLTADAAAVLHARRCGWFSGHGLGMLLLERAREAGVELVNARVEGVEVAGGRVTGVRLSGPGGTESVATGRFVNAAGPLIGEVGRMLDIDLPVFSELHLKTSYKDPQGVIPREAPLLIWEDGQSLEWLDDEREMLAADEEMHWLLKPFPAGVHARPEGALDGQNVLILWPYHTDAVPFAWPPPEDPFLPELAIRGMARMVPGLETYFERLPRPFVDGGYYTKTQENRLLACPLPVDGAYLLGALSGFGLMASQAAAELLAAHLTGDALPDYAPAFSLTRYDDPTYVALLDEWGPQGQL
jgi:glycine/D-amino acid oxidase-like deaminating enzyme